MLPHKQNEGECSRKHSPFSISAMAMNLSLWTHGSANLQLLKLSSFFIFRFPLAKSHISHIRGKYRFHVVLVLLQNERIHVIYRNIRPPFSFDGKCADKKSL